MYLSARAWGIQPSEFWDMTLPEFYAEFESRLPDQKGHHAGKLTDDDVAELKEYMHGAPGTQS